MEPPTESTVRVSLTEPSGAKAEGQDLLRDRGEGLVWRLGSWKGHLEGNGLGAPFEVPNYCFVLKGSCLRVYIIHNLYTYIYIHNIYIYIHLDSCPCLA